MLRISIVVFLALILTLAGCTYRSASDSDDQANSMTVNGLEPLTYTVYSDNMELFVEFRPLVVGQKIPFTAHYTVLGDTFKPLQAGALTVSLIRGDKGIRVTVDSLSSPGIFQFSLEPKYAGQGTLIFELNQGGVSTKIQLTDLPIYASVEEAAKAQKPHSHGSEVVFSKEQAWQSDFATVETQLQPFQGVIRTSGQFITAPMDESTVSATSSGIVKLNFPALEGTAVQAGQALFSISSKELTERNVNRDILEADNNLQLAKSNFERAKLAIADKIISEADFLSKKVAYENAQVTYSQLSRNQRNSGKTVNATKSGFIKSLQVTDGSYVTEGSSLATITSSKNVLLQANLYQADLAKANDLVAANFKVAGDDKVYDTALLSGRLISVGKTIGDHAPYVPVLFQLSNVGAIYPGAFAEVYLKTKQGEPRITVPRSALLEEQGSHYVYVQLNGETFEKRQVKLGESDGIHVAVQAGLAVGERVVSKGAYQIKIVNAAGALPAHGHEH